MQKSPTCDLIFLLLLLPPGHSAIASILLETRLGCLEKEIPSGTREFIDSISMMFSNLFYALLMPKWSRGLLPYWRRFIAGWDGIFNFGMCSAQEVTFSSSVVLHTAAWSPGAFACSARVCSLKLFQLFTVNNRLKVIIKVITHWDKNWLGEQVA